MSIRVVTDARWWNRELAIWFLHETAGGPPSRMIRFGADGKMLIGDAIAEGEALPPEPTLSIPMDAARSLISALSEHASPSESMSAHLRDAITVRDRLLSIVERES